ncbi:MAG: AsmA-like C-terminal domain-containing protein, partial [Deltaproteobacteria bacterium]
IREGTLKQKHWPFSLVLKEGRLKIGEENRFQGSGSWGASSFEWEGAFFMKGLSIEPQWAEVVARLDLGQLWSVTSPDQHPELFKGSAVCRSSITRDGGLWSVKGTAELGALSVDHDLFLMNPPGNAGPVRFDVDFLPHKQIRIKQLQWEPGKSRLNLSGDYPLSTEGDITIQCSAPALSLEDLGLRQKPGDYVVRGSLIGKLQAKIARKDLFPGAVSGEIKGENLSFHPAAFPTPVRDCDFRALFSGDKIVIPSLTLETGESSLKANGELRGWKGLKGVFTATLNPLDLSDFISPSKDGQQKKEPSAFAENTNIRVSLDAQPAQWKRIVSESLRAELLFTGNDFHIISSQIRVDRGAIDVSGYVKDEAMAFSGHVEFKDQPMEALLKRLGIEPAYEGSLTMEAQLYTEGKTLGDLISHLDGRTNVLIEKGVIRKSNVFLQVLEFLSLQAVFTKRPPDISKEGLYFESLGGHGHIEKGVVRTENAQMKGPVINAVAIGSADLGQGLADFDLGVQPLGTIDAVVSKIPILGHILTGEGKSLITYYFEVKGPITGPRVEHVPFKTVGEGVAGILKRLFLSPVKLFEDLSDGIKQLPAPENGQSPSTQHSGH